MCVEGVKSPCRCKRTKPDSPSKQCANDNPPTHGREVRHTISQRSIPVQLLRVTEDLNAIPIPVPLGTTLPTPTRCTGRPTVVIGYCTAHQDASVRDIFQIPSTHSPLIPKVSTQLLEPLELGDYSFGED